MTTATLEAPDQTERHRDRASEPTSRSTPLRLRTVFLLSTIPLLVLYWLTRAPTVTGEDSGELVTAACTLEIAHPPGYPLWLLITHTFQQVFQGLNPAEAANLSCGVTTAVAMGLLGVLAYLVTGSGIAAFLGAAVCGIGHEIWNHATITEVYPLNLLILVGCLLLFRRWAQEPHSCKRLLALCLVYGAGLTHHPTFQLFLPVFAVGVLCVHWRIVRSPKHVVIGLLGLVLPFVVYLQVWIAALHDPWVSWGVEPDVPSIIGHYMREVYWTGLEKTARTLPKLLGQGEAHLQFALRELSLPGLLLGWAGLWMLFRRRRGLGGLCLALAVVGTVVQIPLLNFDLEREDMFGSRVFLMPAYLLLALGLSVSVAKGLRMVRGRPLALARWGVVAVPVIAVVIQYGNHDRSRYYWVEDYGRAILERLPRDAVLTPGGDTSTFPLLYLQRCLGVRADVSIIDRSGTIERDEALATLREDRRAEFQEVSRNHLLDALMCLSDRPFVTLRNRPPPDDTGITLDPCGLGWLAVPARDRKGRARLREFQARFLEELRFRNEAEPTLADYSRDIVLSHVGQVRARQHFRDGDPPAAVATLHRVMWYARGIKETANNVGAMLAEADLRERALDHFRIALAIRPDYRLARRNMVITLAAMGEERRPETLRCSESGMVSHPTDDVIFEAAARAAIDLEDGDALERICSARIDAVRTDPRPHRILGRWARESGNPALARMHLAKAVEKDPSSLEARDELAEAERTLGLPPVPGVGSEEPGSFDSLRSLLRPGSDVAFASPESWRARRFGTAADPTRHIPGGTDVETLLQRERGPGGTDPLSGITLPDPVRRGFQGPPGR